VFERFTERARQVVVLAQDEARRLKHGYIGTEHLLLGLLREEEGLACRVLTELGVTLEDARAQVARIVGPGEEATTGQVPFTPRAKKVLELALREAIALGHDYIGTEHVLLGLVREGEGVAAQILSDSGLTADRVRDELIRMLGGPRAEAIRFGPARRLERFRRRRQPATIRPLSDEVRALFSGGHFVHLASVLPDGAPHSVPLWTIVHEGRIAFFTQPESRKARNLRDDQRVALSVVDRGNPYHSAWVRGRVTATMEGEDALALIDRISDAYTGEPFPMRTGTVYLVDVERFGAVTLPFGDRA
jgi:PPOX class probable F420-dependent enzyme